MDYDVPGDTTYSNASNNDSSTSFQCIRCQRRTDLRAADPETCSTHTRGRTSVDARRLPRLMIRAHVAATRLWSRVYDGDIRNRSQQVWGSAGSSPKGATIRAKQFP